MSDQEGNVLGALFRLQEEARARLEQAKAELRDIEAAISAVEKNRDPSSRHVASTGNPLSVNKAIVEAIKNGATSPAQIKAFMETHLAVKTTANSISTRLNTLRAAGVIERSELGWGIPTPLG